MLGVFRTSVANAAPSLNCTASNPGPGGLLDVVVSGTSSSSDSLRIVASGGTYSLSLDTGGGPSSVCSTYPDSGASGYPTVEVTGTLLSTTFSASDSGLTFVGQAGIANTLDFSSASASALVVNASGATVSGQATDTARLDATTDSFSNITGFTGLSGGNSVFLAGSTGGYTFTGFGSGNALDLSEAGTGASVSVPDGTVSGLTSGGDDEFSGISTFVGSSSGSTTLAAGSGGLTFHGQGTGNALDLSQVSTSPLTPLCTNVSGGPVSTASCGMVANNSGVVGSTTYTFSGVTSFTGASSGNTSFFAGETGGYTFTGQASNNTVDLSAAGSGVSVSVPAGKVSGLSGGDDQFSGIAHFVGAGAGGNSFLAGSTDNQTFTGPGNGNSFTGGSGSNDTFASSGNSNTFTAGSGSATFTSTGSNNTLDFSPVVTTSGSPLLVNLSGNPFGGLADDQAGVGTTTYTFSGINNFTGASSGHTRFLAGSSALNVQGQGSGNTLDFSQASGLGLVVNVSGATVSGQATDTARLGTTTDGFSGVSGFAGLSGGNSVFLAGATGGYTFTGFGTGNVLDLSESGTGVTVSVPDGTVTGLASGGDDTFAGITNFTGSSVGGTTLVAGSSGLSFHGQGSGNALDFSRVTTSSSAPLLVNVSGAPVNYPSLIPGPPLPNNSAEAGLAGAVYTFSGVKSFTGSNGGNTVFAAGSNGGYTFTGLPNNGMFVANNTLDLSASSVAVSLSVPAGSASGLTGGADQFSGISTFDGPAAGNSTFTGGPAGLEIETFNSAGNGNAFIAGSGPAVFNGGAGQGNSLDFSPVVTSSGAHLWVNLSGGPIGSVANNSAVIGSTTFQFSGISTFDGAASGYTDFYPSSGGGSTFNGHGAGNTLDLSHTPGVASASVSVPAAKLTIGAVQNSFSGIQGFVGAAAGNTSFVAGAGGGYSFTGNGSGNSLDLSAAGSGVTVSVPDGTVTGLATGGDDTFAGITNFTGSSVGGTTLVAGSSGLSFHGQGSGNTLDFSQIATDPVAALAINVTGGPVTSALYGVIANNSAVASFVTYSFADVTGFTGSSSGNTYFQAGSEGGYTFNGQSSGNTLDLSAAPGATVIANGNSPADPGLVTGLTSGTDSFSGIQHFAGAILTPGLSVTKTADAAVVSTGSSIGFTVTASNSSAAGTGTASGVTLSDSLPGGTGVSWSIAPSYSGPGSCSITGSAPSQTLSCSLGDLAPGASASVHVSSATTASSAGTYLNTARLSATNVANPLQASATTSVLAPALSITKTADAAAVSTGTSIGFTVEVSNSPDGATGIASGVKLSDPLPGGTGVSWSVTPSYSGPGSCSITGSAPSQTLSCSFGSMAPGASASVHVSSATTASSAGTYPNTASASATNVANPIQASATVMVVKPAGVTSVSSTAANATYGVGTPIPVTVSFDKTVNVTGTPQLTLNSGATVNYAYGSGTSTLTFTYTVAAGENADPLDESSASALSLNGGSIQDATNIDANLALPAPGTSGALGVNKTIVIDTTPPTVTISTTANKDTATGWYTIASSGTSGILVSVSASDPAGVSSLLCWDGMTNVLNTMSSSGSVTLHDGDHHVSCSATDTVGNGGAASGSTGRQAGPPSTATAEFKVDQTRPTIVPSIGTPKYGSSPTFVTSTSSLAFAVSDATSGVNSCSITVTAPASNTYTPACGAIGGSYKLDSALLGATPGDGVYSNVADATDTAGNHATENSLSVTLDNTAPAITITIPPSSNSANPTVYTYGSVPNASYSCNDGSGSGVASSGGCIGKVDGTATVNNGSALVGTVGLHTLTVTSKDNVGNTTTVNHYYDVQAPTSVLYTGDETVTSPAAVNLAATLSSSAAACTTSQSLTFTITDANNTTTTKTGTTNSSGAVGPISVSLPEGVYTVQVSYAGLPNKCLPASDEATLVVGSSGSKATGGGWTTINGVGRVNFAFVVDQVAGTGTSPSNPAQYKGQYVLVKPNGWRFKGTFGNAVGGTYVVTTTKTGKSGSGTGTGTVYVWNAGSTTFVPAAGGANVTFSIGFADNGSGGKKQATPDLFGNHDNYDPIANGYNTALNPFPNFTIQAIKGGNITVS